MPGKAHMNEIDFTELLPAVVRRYTGERSFARCPIFLTLPDNLPKLPGDSSRVEELIYAVINSVVSAVHPGRPMRMAALQKKRLEDLENLLDFHPSRWIQLRLEVQSLAGAESEVRELPERFGFKYQDQWEVEESDPRLIAYTCGEEATPALIICLEDHRGNHRYSFLFPITVQQDQITK
jgi:hypothetical protein